MGMPWLCYGLLWEIAKQGSILEVNLFLKENSGLDSPTGTFRAPFFDDSEYYEGGSLWEQNSKEKKQTFSGLIFPSASQAARAV